MIYRCSVYWEIPCCGTKWAGFRTEGRFSHKADVSSPIWGAALIAGERHDFLVLDPDCLLELMVPDPLGF